ncbi:MAG: YqgE/AlgH family protein, partial [Coxiellaceae bacterium]|nr:YqgE/AlgH family protein [Coxiellaceae bacterium]
MNKISTFKNQLLVAMPSLSDPLFKQSVAYIFEHGELGAMGIVINKPMNLNISNMFEMLQIPVNDPELDHLPVLSGGPVAREQGFIIHREHNIGNGELTSHKHHIVISASKEDLITLPQTNYQNIIVTLGYAGWGEGQLEREVIQNDWLIVPLDP